MRSTSTHATEDHGVAPRTRERHTVAHSFVVDAAIDDLAKVLQSADPSRWSPFVTQSIPGSDLIAVVAPKRLSGTKRLTGMRSPHVADGRLVFDATHRRGGLLRIVHDLRLQRAGSFRTTVHLTTTTRGLASTTISRRRVSYWHALEADTLAAYAEATKPGARLRPGTARTSSRTRAGRGRSRPVPRRVRVLGKVDPV